jgi:hypothetical protein
MRAHDRRTELKTLPEPSTSPCVAAVRWPEGQIVQGRTEEGPAHKVTRNTRQRNCCDRNLYGQNQWLMVRVLALKPPLWNASLHNLRKATMGDKKMINPTRISQARDPRGQCIFVTQSATSAQCHVIVLTKRKQLPTMIISSAHATLSTTWTTAQRQSSGELPP